MSGAITASTIIAGIGAAASVGSTIYGVVNGQAQNATQQAALKKQNTAQQTAEAAALSQQRQAQVAQGEQNKATPDVSAILRRAATVGSGLSSTMLTGGGGDTGTLNLGKTSLLGS